MNARGSTEGIFSHDRVVIRNRNARGGGRKTAIFLQFGQIAIDPTQEPQSDKEQIHWSVADPFAQSDRRSMYLIGAGKPGCERISEIQPAVPMTVPVDADAVSHN